MLQTGLMDASWLPHLIDIAIAYALALPIGWDREEADRSAGLRTFPLVAVASCSFILATESIMIGHPEGRARIIEGVITGIGFIGGGAILKTERAVRGTATAASLWATASIGVATGLRSYEVAIMMAAVTFATLRFLAPWKPRIAKHAADSGDGADREDES
jgi:putative Mg2+ transporter-C (MgtC) family protein